MLNGPLITATTLPDERGSSAVTHWVELKRETARRAKRAGRAGNVARDFARAGD